MALEIRPGITIRRPRREVAAVMFDPRYDDAWLETIRATEAGEPAPAEGAVRERRMRFLLREIALSLRVTGFDPERFIEFSADEPFPLVIRQDLESIPEGTLVRMRVRVALAGGLSLLQPLVRWRLRRSVIGDLEALKALVENSQHRGLAAVSPAAPSVGHAPPVESPAGFPARSPTESRVRAALGSPAEPRVDPAAAGPATLRPAAVPTPASTPATARKPLASAVPKLARPGAQGSAPTTPDW